jgi:hypothetical protein
MKPQFHHYFLIPLCGLCLHAGTVDVSAAQSALVQQGGMLTFDISSSSYTAHAQAYGLSVYPSDLYFSFVTSANTTGQFSATLSSPDASNSVALDPLDFISGSFSSAGFQGAVSVLQAHFHLNPAFSADIFSTGIVQLSLQNTGGSMNLGLASQTLRQDLMVSLSGGALSVGAGVLAVTLNNPIQLAFAPGSIQLAGPPVPEPNPGAMLAIGGAILFGVSTALKRHSRGSW